MVMGTSRLIVWVAKEIGINEGVLGNWVAAQAFRMSPKSRP
jgi:hypothetical protein